MSPNAGSPDPVILSVHVFRRQARKRERQIQACLSGMYEGGISVPAGPDGETFRLPQVGAPDVDLPLWTRGVRVEKAGPFQHAVVATHSRGH